MKVMQRRSSEGQPFKKKTAAKSQANIIIAAKTGSNSPETINVQANQINVSNAQMVKSKGMNNTKSSFGTTKFSRNASKTINEFKHRRG